jgi:hypothetical protein
VLRDRSAPAVPNGDVLGASRNPENQESGILGFFSISTSPHECMTVYGVMQQGRRAQWFDLRVPRNRAGCCAIGRHLLCRTATFWGRVGTQKTKNPEFLDFSQFQPRHTSAYDCVWRDATAGECSGVIRVCHTTGQSVARSVGTCCAKRRRSGAESET